MGINRMVRRRNGGRSTKKVINAIIEDLNDCRAIAEDYIPRARNIAESLTRLHNYFTTVEEDDERLEMINEFSGVSDSLIPQMEDIYTKIIEILRDPRARLRSTDDRLEALELINNFYICKIEMVELHKNFALHIERDIFKGGN